jgi:CheY-like chemotaxis protein
MMPVMDGMQMLNHLREQQNVTPVVLLSAAIGQRRTEGAQRADAYLAKPFHPDTLFRLVERFTTQPADALAAMEAAAD